MGRSMSLSSPRSTAARPPLSMRTCAPVALWTAIEKSGSWPTRRTSSPCPSATSAGSKGPPASWLSTSGSTPSASQASRAVSAALTLGLVRHASRDTPSAARAAPAARACSSPRLVSGRSASGEPSAASPWRNSQITGRQHTYPLEKEEPGNRMETTTAHQPAVDLEAPELYENRELSWLDFNDRVLQLAEDERVPLLERVKFLAIWTSNLDEFFMVRVAGLHDQVDAGIDARVPDGRAPERGLRAPAPAGARGRRDPDRRRRGRHRRRS